jgi:hypothetical protein
VTSIPATPRQVFLSETSNFSLAMGYHSRSWKAIVHCVLPMMVLINDDSFQESPDKHSLANPSLIRFEPLTLPAPLR